jgi:hypothetical protein
MPHGLKAKNRINNLLYDHTWIPGVEEDESIENGNGDDEQEVDFYDEMEPDEIEELAHQNNASKEDVRHMEKESETDIDEEDYAIMQKETEYQTNDENESQINFQSDEENEDQSKLHQEENTEQMNPEAIPTEGITITRSGRESKQPIRLNLQ